MTGLRRGLSLAVLSLAVPLHAAGLDTKVTVNARQAPVSRFLDALSTQAKVNFILTEGVETKRVTAFLHDVTAKDALDVLKQTAGLGYRQVGKSNTYIIASQGSPELSPQAVEGGSELDQRVTIRVKNAPLDQFFDTLSAQTKLSFALDEGLEGRRVTAFLNNVTVREALEVLLTMKGLAIRRLDDRKTYGVGEAKK